MPEPDDDRLLRDTFERYRRAHLPTMVAPGVGAARATLARRRRRRTVSLVAVVVLALVAGAGATLAAVRPDRAAHHTPPATSHTPRPTHSRSPSTSPSASPSATPPDGRIPARELFNATLDLPGWPHRGDCAGRRTFHDGVNQASGTSWAIRLTSAGGGLPEPRYADLDGDGAQETVAVISCGAQGLWYQAVAFDRDRHGRIVTMGQVARTPWSDMSMVRMDGLSAAADGTIGVRWTQLHEESPVSQWRQYRWNGGGFDQTGGPAGMPGPPTVRVAVRSTMSAATDGYTGTLTMTVTNDAGSANPVRWVSIHLTLPSGVSASPSAHCGDSFTMGGGKGRCEVPDVLAPGESWTATLTLTSSADHQPEDRTLRGSVLLRGEPASVFTAAGDTSFTVTLPAAS